MTTIELREAAVGRGPAAELPPTTLLIEPGHPTVVAVETSERPMVLSLVIGGRMAPSAGAVTIDGRRDRSLLPRRTALVDTPFVAEPTPAAALSLVVAEELAFAGRPSRRRDVDRFLSAHGATELAAVPMRAVPPAVRVLLLSELALLREGVECIVVSSPERHGGDPAAWFRTLVAVAERGTSVVVITDAATAAALKVLS